MIKMIKERFHCLQHFPLAFLPRYQGCFKKNNCNIILFCFLKLSLKPLVLFWRNTKPGDPVCIQQKLSHVLHYSYDTLIFPLGFFLSKLWGRRGGCSFSSFLQTTKAKVERNKELKLGSEGKNKVWIKSIKLRYCM